MESVNEKALIHSFLRDPLSLLHRINRLDYLMEALEKKENPGLMEYSSDRYLGGRLSQSLGSPSPNSIWNEHCKPVDSVLKETQLKGSLVERVASLEKKLFILTESLLRKYGISTGKEVTDISSTLPHRSSLHCDHQNHNHNHIGTTIPPPVSSVEAKDEILTKPSFHPFLENSSDVNCIAGDSLDKFMASQEKILSGTEGDAMITKSFHRKYSLSSGEEVTHISPTLPHKNNLHCGHQNDNHTGTTASPPPCFVEKHEILTKPSIHIFIEEKKSSDVNTTAGDGLHNAMEKSQEQSFSVTEGDDMNGSLLESAFAPPDAIVQSEKAWVKTYVLLDCDVKDQKYAKEERKSCKDEEFPPLLWSHPQENHPFSKKNNEENDAEGQATHKNVIKKKNNKKNNNNINNNNINNNKKKSNIVKRMVSCFCGNKA